MRHGYHNPLDVISFLAADDKGVAVTTRNFHITFTFAAENRPLIKQKAGGDDAKGAVVRDSLLRKSLAG